MCQTQKQKLVRISEFQVKVKYYICSYDYKLWFNFRRCGTSHVEHIWGRWGRLFSPFFKSPWLLYGKEQLRHSTKFPLLCSMEE